MRLLINQKYFAFNDRFNITAENGQPVYAVEGKFFTIGKKFHIERPNGQEIFFVKQRLFRIFARYDFLQNDQDVGFLKRKYALFIKKLTFRSEAFGKIKIKGNILGWSFRFFDENGNQIAETSKKILHIADTYTLDIFDPRYQDIIVGLVVAIDAIYHRKH
jgi:uncharacterized protein YxjI